LAKGYSPEAWALLHIVGDETFAAMLKKQSSEFKKSVRDLFSDGDIAAYPISKPKPYIKQYSPKTYKLLFATN